MLDVCRNVDYNMNYAYEHDRNVIHTKRERIESSREIQLLQNDKIDPISVSYFKAGNWKNLNLV